MFCHHDGNEEIQRTNSQLVNSNCERLPCKSSPSLVYIILSLQFTSNQVLAPIVVPSLPILTNISLFDVNYKSILFKREGQLVPLDSNIESSIEKVFSLLNGLKFRTENQWKREKSYFQFNYSKSDYMVASGSIWLHQCRLCLPYNVSFTRLDQAIDFLEIKGIYLDWESPENVEVASTYLLSEFAKQYIIAQGVCQLWNKKFLPFHVLVNGILSSVFFVCYQTPQPTPIKLTLIGLFLLGILMISSTIDSIVTIESVEEALKLNDHYLDGAIEFYQKIQQRNKLLNSRLVKQSNPMDRLTKLSENEFIDETLDFLMKEKTKRMHQSE